MPSNNYQIIQEFLPKVVVNQIVKVDFESENKTSEIHFMLTTGKEAVLTLPVTYLNDNPQVFKKIESNWYPQMGEEYFALNKDGFISRWVWEDSLINHEVYAFGNCFPNKELAEKARVAIQEVFKQIMSDYKPRAVHGWKNYNGADLR